MLKTHIYIIVLFLLSFLKLDAQDRKLDYLKKLTISEGLAHNGVTSILEDSKGYLWFGTYNGLNKYDGYNIRTFKNNIDQDILTSNRVRALKEDSAGNLWIGTDEGITIYNYSQEKFTKLYSNKLNNEGFSGPIIRDIITDHKTGMILCATEGYGILVFNKDYKLSGQYYPNVPSKDQVLFFKGMRLSEKEYLFTSSRGLFLFNSESKQFQRILSDDIHYSNSITKIDNNKLLVTLLNGAVIIEFTNKQNIYNFKLADMFFKDKQFKSSMIDGLGNLWLGTLNNGIIQIEKANLIDSKKKINQKVFNDGLSVLRSSSMIATSNNTCWVATFNEGVYEFDVNINPFNFYNSKMNYPYGLNSNNVNHIAPLDKDRAYLSSPLGGMALFNTQNQKFEPIKSKILSDLFPKITTIFIDSKKNSWIRIFGSRDLYRLKEGSSQYDVISLSNLVLTDNLALIRSFTEDKYGNIWIGTNNGVYKVTISETNDVVKLESLNDIPFFSKDKLSLARFVYADPLHNFIWIGADSDGLYRIENQSNVPLEKLSVKQFIRNKSNKFSLSSNFVTSVIRLPNDELWVGTEGGGVCKVIDSDLEPKFIAFTEKNGLSNNVVKNILFDDEYNLWILTNIGLNKLNTKDFSIRKFNMSDGLPFEDFWFEAKRLKNGIMVLSGLDGFCYFNPNDIRKNEPLPKVEFENLKIFNKAINSGDTIANRVLLKKRLAELEEITLKYNENVFSIDITSLHFSNPENHAIKYRMLPLNKEWVEATSSNNTIEFSGLQPGEYELSVMASNSLNEWTPPKNIKIIITPPFWKTNLAYFIYFLLLVLTIYIINRVALRIQALKHKVEIEQLEINNVKDSNEAKLRFFTNISHEIKTPLSLIMGPTNSLLERFNKNPETGKKLALIQRQSKKILQLIEQVQDFRRADVNLLKMDYNRFNFDAFIEELIIDFKFLADNDNKQLEIESGSESIIVSADRDKLEKIFNNLLNNSFKYTRTNDSIKIKYKKEGKDLIVSVIDTGRGINSDDLEHVFERFYQSKCKDNIHISGSGIGLAFSKRLVEMHYGFISADSVLNEGTTITIRLPIVKKHLPTDVLVDIDLPKDKEVSLSSELIQENTASDIKVTGEFSEAIIFYAEDNLEMRNYVSSLLSKFFKVKSFRNGKECLDALEDEWPDIVISDVQMPEMNGLELCIRIKSDLKTSHIPVILLTALTNIEDHLQGIRDGADAYIMKPFNVQQLITNTEALLSTRKQLRERYQIGIPLTKENNKNNRNDNAFLEKLYSLIEENLDNQDFDLNNLARELYLNRTHFYQKVKVLTNQTPFELLKMYRLKKAAEILVEKQLSVNEVYVMTGFKSRTHFSKIFKEIYGVSPSHYAAEALNKQRPE